MPADQRVRELRVQFCDEFLKCFLLCGGAGVGWFAVGIQSTDVANAERILIVTAYVRARDIALSSEFDSSVGGNHVVIADIGKSAVFHMKFADVGGAEFALCRVPRAMNDDVFNYLDW